MTADDRSEEPRTALARLAAERREELSGLSRLIGRNPAYIHQFIHRGTPRRLAEEDRRRLARYFGVAEAVLGGPDEAGPSVAAADSTGARGADLIAVPRYDVAASAGAGSLAAGEGRTTDLHFPAALLRRLGAGDTGALSLVRVAGDSMLPSLGDGDDILVDRSDGPERLRDGVYVLRHEEALLVKRVRLARGGFSVLSDNRAYPSWRNADPAAFAIVGRVLWSGGRVR